MQQFQAAFDFGVHDPGRVQEGRIGPPGIVQIGIANPIHHDAVHGAVAVLEVSPTTALAREHARSNVLGSHVNEFLRVSELK